MELCGVHFIPWCYICESGIPVFLSLKFFTLFICYLLSWSSRPRLLRPLFCLFYQPRMMMGDERGVIGGMIGMGQRRTRRKPALGRLFHHKSRMIWHRLEPGLPRWDACDKPQIFQNFRLCLMPMCMKFYKELQTFDLKWKKLLYGDIRWRHHFCANYSL
jgi:hypothetical protein